jgi:hypothetical protein
LKIAASVLAVTSAVLAAPYYQTTRDIETEKASVASLQLALAKEVARAVELKADLNAARTDA